MNTATKFCYRPTIYVLTSEIEILPSCSLCGGELVEKDVQKLLRGGIHTAVLRVKAEVCLQCSERLYAKETVSRFEAI